MVLGPDEPPDGRRGFVPRPPGEYAFYKEFIEDAVRTNAPPAPELIANNKILASWEAYLGIGKVSSFPVVVGAAVTDVCNARCSFCSYAPETATGRRVALADIERADWLRFVERFFPNSALGEPFVHPQIAEIFEAVRRQAPYIKVGITTNAALLTPRINRAIVGLVSQMAVSINAARPESYERLMAPLKWDRTMANLTALAEEKARVGTDLPDVQGSIVVHRHNLDELPEFPAVLRAVGIDKMRVLVMSVPRPIASRQLFGHEDLIHHEPARANRAFRALEVEAARLGVRLINRPPTLVEA